MNLGYGIDVVSRTFRYEVISVRIPTRLEPLRAAIAVWFGFLIER